MSESDETQYETTGNTSPGLATVTTADKRNWLQKNGYEVGSRGKLSAEHEAAYISGTPAGQEQPTAL